MTSKVTTSAIAAVLAASLSLGSFFLTPQAEAKGCLKGAVVGGVAGHFVGSGHGLLGAAGGCLVGRHMARKHREQDWQRQHQQQDQYQRTRGY